MHCERYLRIRSKRTKTCSLAVIRVADTFCGLLIRYGVNLSHTVDCNSPGQRHWPEDLAWHPLGETLFAVYTADGGPQVAIINTSKKVSTMRRVLTFMFTQTQI